MSGGWHRGKVGWQVSRGDMSVRRVTLPRKGWHVSGGGWHTLSTFPAMGLGYEEVSFSLNWEGFQRIKQRKHNVQWQFASELGLESVLTGSGFSTQLLMTQRTTHCQKTRGREAFSGVRVKLLEQTGKRTMPTDNKDCSQRNCFFSWFCSAICLVLDKREKWHI